MESNDKNSKLPEGWVSLNLDLIRDKKGAGITPNKHPEEVFELYSVPVFESRKPEITEGKHIGSNKQIVAPHMVLLCKINPRINRVWVVGDFSKNRKIASTEWITFPKTEGIDPKYLCYYFQNPLFRNFLNLV
ncbi:hypothetical protein C7271_26435 [filamentous cyanobacterium CCP5]|nr:hypothetical protein C7271_26435 [filamentous cyanobacterium CCP5]